MEGQIKEVESEIDISAKNTRACFVVVVDNQTVDESRGGVSPGVQDSGVCKGLIPPIEADESVKTLVSCIEEELID